MLRAPWLIVVVFLAGCLQGAETPPAPTTSEPPVVYEAIRFDTDLGPVTVLLYPEAAPQTVDLMKAYVAEGYYVGREFNRVVPGHVIQVFDKTGEATEDARRAPLETTPDHHFSAGAAGIARGEDPDGGGPEFFIMDFATSHLDGNYTVWGQVVQGLDVVHRIARVPAAAYPALPDGVPVGPPTDRQAVQAARITGTSLVRITLDPQTAKGLPLEVAKNVRVDDWRHSLEWPNDLAPGAAAKLTWYLRPYEGAPPAPRGSDLAVRVSGIDVPVLEDADAPGAYHWTWTPPAGGGFNATLIHEAQALATLQVTVAS